MSGTALPSRWLKITLIVLCVLGTLVSLYYIHHYYQIVFGFSPESTFCAISEYVNCDDLQFTPDATLFGLPIGGFSLFFFLFFIQIILMYGRVPERWLSLLIRLTALAGFLMMLQKAGFSFFVYRRLCISCLFGWAILLILFVLVWFLWPRPGGPLRVPWRGVIKPAAISVGLAFFSIIFVPNIMFSQNNKEVRDAIRRELSHVLRQTPRAIPESFVDLSHPDGDYHKGDADAPIRIIVFSEVECPYCRMAHEVFKSVLFRFKGDVLLVFKNNPQDHSCNPYVLYAAYPFACLWANAARCMGRHDPAYFWDTIELAMHKNLYLYKYPAMLSTYPDHIAAEAEQCIVRNKEMLRIQADIQQAMQLGVPGNPAIFVNGYEIKGYRPYLFFEKMIKKLLAEHRRAER